MLIGIYGLLFEFIEPGRRPARRDRRASACCWRCIALQMLPVNYAGLALIAARRRRCMIAEAFAPSFGVLGFGGIVAFVIGSVILIDTDVPGFGMPLGVHRRHRAGVGAALVFAVAAAGAAGAPARRSVSGDARRWSAQPAQVLDGLAQATGWATVHGERWRVSAQRAAAARGQTRARHARSTA